MKKFFTAILSIALAATLALGSTACSSVTQLSFSDKWNDSISSNHKSITETLEYTVMHTENYNDVISMSNDITKDVLDFSYEEGKYIQKLSASSTLPEDVPNNLSAELYADSLFYHLHTELSIPAHFKANADKAPVDHVDTVITDTYFLSAGQSLAPIWSRTIVENVYVHIASGESAQAQTAIGNYEYVFEYSQNEYKMISIMHSTDGNQTEKTFSYTYKTAIDNTQLLFALRNITLEENVASKIPTISPAYGEAKTLSVTHKESSIYSNTIKFTSPESSVEKKMEIPVKDASFLIDATRDTGAFHYVKIQKSKTDDIPFRSLITEYAAPTISFGAFKCLGAMVYKLTAVTIEQA